MFRCTDLHIDFFQGEDRITASKHHTIKVLHQSSDVNLLLTHYAAYNCTIYEVLTCDSANDFSDLEILGLKLTFSGLVKKDTSCDDVQTKPTSFITHVHHLT